MDAFMPWEPAEQEQVTVEINDVKITVPKTALNVYHAEAHTDEHEPQKVTDSILTIDVMLAWTWLIETLAERGWGEVVAFDVAIKNGRRWRRNLGRIDGPTKPPHPVRHTSANASPERSR
jgi:hypothetical protein